MYWNYIIIKIEKIYWNYKDFWRRCIEMCWRNVLRNLKKKCLWRYRGNVLEKCREMSVNMLEKCREMSVNVLEKWRRKCLWIYIVGSASLVWVFFFFLLPRSFATAQAITKFVRHYRGSKPPEIHHLVTAQAVTKCWTDFSKENTIFLFFWRILFMLRRPRPSLTYRQPRPPIPL
jgi:hypothetical protein